MDTRGNMQEMGEEAKKIPESFLEVVESDYILELGCVMALWTILFLFGKYSVLDLKKYFGPDYFVKGIKNVKFFP